ncbi:MAG: hypothetical protein Q9170_005485 [Blastenia crenularia]
MSAGSNKRRRPSDSATEIEDSSESDLFEISATEWNTAAQNRNPRQKGEMKARGSISPPAHMSTIKKSFSKRLKEHLKIHSVEQNSALGPLPFAQHGQTTCTGDLFRSPIQLSTVNGLAASSNIDTDTRDMVQVKIVHGSWKKEDSNRINIEMIIIFRHDEQAQVNIITGNFIVRDWSMCQAVWRSPLLPLSDRSIETTAYPDPPCIGSGARFKKDLVAYLRAYGSKRTGPLTTELDNYDFSSIRAALIASVPSKQYPRNKDPDTETLWGWPALRHILSHIEMVFPQAKPHIVLQCSSIASVGEKWMEDTFLKALSVSRPSSTPKSQRKAKFSLVYPTADEIRRSVDGYGSGGSIHMKTQNAGQVKQLNYLKPMFCHWAGDQGSDPTSREDPNRAPVRRALRRRAAPHIKTYMRFSDEEMTRIDWAIMTSANLSKQAWGEAMTAAGEVRICSYEIGLVAWPGLWDDDGKAAMVPVFGQDMPDDADDRSAKDADNDGGEQTTDEEGGKGLRGPMIEKKKACRTRVGLRMPYDLPLTPYAQEEMPWCASTPCLEPDWMGRSWAGYGGS